MLYAPNMNFGSGDGDQNGMMVMNYLTKHNVVCFNMKTIIKLICNTCSCDTEQAEEYLKDEINNLIELRDLNDLRSRDISTACDNLGISQDYSEYFINILAGC